jgi:hypothetical protein
MTTPRPTPLTVTELPQIGWKANLSKPLLQNLQDLYSTLGARIRKLRTRKLDTAAHEALKQETGEALKQLGQEADLILLYERYLSQPLFAEKAKEIESLSNQTILRFLLSKFTKQNTLKNSSHQFGEAWLEIEAQSTLEQSLLNLEQARRKLKETTA